MAEDIWQAFKRIRDKYPDIEFPDVFGKQPLRDEINRLNNIIAERDMVIRRLKGLKPYAAGGGTDSAWISVEDRLPELGKRVLFFDMHDEMHQCGSLNERTGGFGKHLRWFFDNGNDDILGNCITHWMPLPPSPVPPEGEG